MSTTFLGVYRDIDRLQCWLNSPIFFPAASSRCTTTFSTTLLPSMLSLSDTLATTSLLLMSTSLWDVDVKLMVSMFLHPR